MKTRLLTALLTLCLVLSLTPISATTVFAANAATVTNETELKTALDNADCTEIKLGSNIETTVGLNVERTVTLDLNGYTLNCSSTDEDIFRISSSGNLTGSIMVPTSFCQRRQKKGGSSARIPPGRSDR